MSIYLVATDGGTSPSGALRIGKLAAEQHGATVEVVGHDTAVSLARAIVERRADLLIVGAGAASLIAELATMTSVPIVAVPDQAWALPRRALLAIDFGAASIRAANVALDLLNRPATALMVSVASPAEGSHLDILLDAIQDALIRPPDVVIDRYRTAGDAVDTILAVAAAQDADVISVGHSGGWSLPGTRAPAIGHVTKAILSAAQCTVAIASRALDHDPL